MWCGDYTSNMIDKEQRLARQEEMYAVQQHEIAHMQQAIKRLALWGKIYDNEKFAKRAKNMPIRLDKMDKMDKPLTERRKMDLQLNGWRGSNKVLELRSIRKAYGVRTLLGETSLEVRRGERVGVIGPNGSGKSVLLRLILGKEMPDPYPGYRFGRGAGERAGGFCGHGAGHLARPLLFGPHGGADSGI